MSESRNKERKGKKHVTSFICQVNEHNKALSPHCEHTCRTGMIRVIVVCTQTNRARLIHTKSPVKGDFVGEAALYD